jgi:glutamine synthetase
MNVLEYICLDSESKFRSKTIFTTNPVDMLEPVVVDSSIVSNVVVESHDLIMTPLKCIKNPFIRQDNHWLVLCDLRYPNGSIHKSNTRDALLNLINSHEDYTLALTQQFVLFNKNKEPLGWSDKIDLIKDYTAKLEYMQYSQPIIDILIENLLYVGIEIDNIHMDRMVSRWSMTFNTQLATDACDELFLVRYILHRISCNNNAFVSFHPDPITSSKIYSRCYFSISSDEMREEDGIQHIVNACKKLEIKHLEQHKFLCPYNGRQFSYGQNSSRYDAIIHLTGDNGGYLEDKRASADCDLYKVAEKLIRTIVTDYDIDTMSANLETLKERFNYTNALNTGINRPVSVLKPTTVEVKSKTKEVVKSTKKSEGKQNGSGLSELAKILRLNNDSDDEENEENEENKTKNMTRVEEIVYNLKNMNISHSILQASSVPKSKNDPPPIEMINQPPIMTEHPNMNPSMMGMPLGAEALPHSEIIPSQHVMPNSLYTLPSQI